VDKEATTPFDRCESNAGLNEAVPVLQCCAVIGMVEDDPRFVSELPISIGLNQGSLPVSTLCFYGDDGIERRSCKRI